MPVLEPNIAIGKIGIHRHGIRGWWLDRLDIELLRFLGAVLVDPIFNSSTICAVAVNC